ncbi:protein far1-related sequence 11-like isoform x3 [Gigaspora margarita]|uniref:Protein far1-related sequence 11-like isoform x3 n=1 Tax=Gigaspora margarita TaxID=4874 RepID=A0A8H4AIB6_GIGMA|nr:protein far1-related sequence 11-like isoform x3 [Gigaspora margarita]
MDENTETFEGQTSNNVGYDQSSDKTINAPVNFATIIRGSEYKDGVCRSRRYACEHQDHYSTKNKTCIVENQQQTRSKHTRCRWQVRASCPKTTEILSINFLSLNHNDHPIEDQTNKFAVKYREFSEDILGK